MSHEVVMRWIEAAKILGTDPIANILCPVCQQTFLKVEDVENKATFEAAKDTNI